MQERFHTPRPAISASGDAGEHSVGHPVQSGGVEHWPGPLMVSRTARAGGMAPGRCPVMKGVLSQGDGKDVETTGLARTNRKDLYFLDLP